MYRHALVPLFDPRTLLAVSDRHLPVLADAALPAQMQATLVQCQPGQTPDWPGIVSELAAKDRLDMVLLCLPAAQVAEALTQLTALRPRALALLPHDTLDPDPKATAAFCAQWSRDSDCVLLGPNSFGLQRPHLGLNLSRHPTLAEGGRVALVSQSRAIMASVMDWAEDVHVGFSAAIALGDEAGIGLADVLDFLATDPRTDSIALYIEDVGLAREFMSALRAAASVKPVVVLKAGRSAESAGHDVVFDAALRRAGAVRVRYFVQLFSSLKVLRYARRPRGRRIALLSNGSGPPQLALDLMGPGAAVLPAELGAATAKQLAQWLEPGAEVRNPVITYVPLTPDSMRGMLSVLLDDLAVDGVLVVLTPDERTDLKAVADQLAEFAPKARKPVITCFMGDAGMRGLRRRLDDAGTPAFRTPESAADGFGILAAHHYNQQLLLQTQPPMSLSRQPDLARAQRIVAGAREQGRQVLSADEAVALLEAFHVALTWRDAPCSPTTFTDSHGDVFKPLPDAAIRVRTDARFGPVISFAPGGVSAQLTGARDRGMDLPPLNSYLARQLIERSRIWRHGLADRLGPPNLAALSGVLERISSLLADVPEVAELDIDGVQVLDGDLFASKPVVRLHPGQPSTGLQHGYPHMAIHPYPTQWVQQRCFADGLSWTLRPIRPEDAEALQAFVRDLSERSRYMRFVSMMRELTPRMLARYTQVDYHRELALVATVMLPNPAHRGHPHEVIIGLAHYLRNADGRGAEYALVVGDDWQRRGLGRDLMTSLIAAAREQGLEYIDGVVLSDNRPMLALMESLGMTNDPDPEDSSLRRVWLPLVGAAGTAR